MDLINQELTLVATKKLGLFIDENALVMNVSGSCFSNQTLTITFDIFHPSYIRYQILIWSFFISFITCEWFA